MFCVYPEPGYFPRYQHMAMARLFVPIQRTTVGMWRSQVRRDILMYLLARGILTIRHLNHSLIYSFINFPRSPRPPSVSRILLSTGYSNLKPEACVSSCLGGWFGIP